MSPGTPYSGIGLTHLILKYASNMKCGSAGTAITLSTGGFSCMNVVSRTGSVAKSCDRCHAASVPAASGRISPDISDGLYLYSAYLSWYPNVRSSLAVPSVHISLFSIVCSPIWASAGQ